jgi:mannitol/fructose-specific phosphotransferase system IIA component (Ntr-type)
MTALLPHVTASEKRELQRELLSSPLRREIFRFSEFLTPHSILFFKDNENKIGAVETLVGTFHGIDRATVLQDIWSREREGALIIPTGVAVMRSCLGSFHHLRVALGICPKGIVNPSNPDHRTQLFIILAGPLDQNHLHMNLLVAVSALFHNRRLVGKILKCGSSDEIIEVISNAENRRNCSRSRLYRFGRAIKEFFELHYGWGRR